MKIFYTYEIYPFLLSMICCARNRADVLITKSHYQFSNEITFIVYVLCQFSRWQLFVANVLDISYGL